MERNRSDSPAPAVPDACSGAACPASDDALRAAAMAVSAAQGCAVFPELTRCLATMLGVDFAMIAALSESAPYWMRTLAMYGNGMYLEDIEYPLAGTPCESVVGQSFRCYREGVARRFRADGQMAQLGIEGYAGYPIDDARGRPVGIIAALSRRPISDPDLAESMMKIFAARAAAEIERTRAEEALRASEEQYRAIFNASVDALVMKDADHRIVDVNEAFLTMHGYRREELIGQRLSEVIPAELQVHCDLLLPGIVAGEPCHIQARTRRRDGTLFDVEIHGVPMQYLGRPHALVVMRDITEAKRAEERLRASEAQYRAIFNASADALILWDSRFRRVDVNSAYERIYGWSRDEVIGRGDDHPAYSPEYARQRLDLVRRALAGEACHAELEAIRKNGEHFSTEVHTIPFLHRGEPHVLAIARDITERRRAEEERARLESQLRQTQKMEAVGHLAGGIAHDFNNILTSVMGYVALAADRPAAAEDPRLGRYLQQAQASCGRARDLIGQMLTFSRVQRGQPRRLRLGPLVAESMRMLRSTLPTTIDIRTDTAGAVPSVLHDPVQVGQVVLNLCINARDAIGAGNGQIHVAVHHLRGARLVCTACRQPLSGDFVELSVADTGSGIPPEILDRIFEPFFTTKEVGKGSGMGLATVHGIVHEQGGHVVVESGAGGSRFRVLMRPLESAGPPPPGEPETSREPRGKVRLRGSVLVVDDEVPVGEFMRDILEGWGIEVTLASDGRQAAETLATAPGRYDLVIADRTMPRMSGVELARHLRALRPEVPVILYTGYADERTVEEARAAGARAVLPKPVEPASLRAVLEGVLAAD